MVRYSSAREFLLFKGKTEGDGEVELFNYDPCRSYTRRDAPREGH